MAKQQTTPMIYDPATGKQPPSYTDPAMWRRNEGATAWLYNPWTGQSRDPRDIGSDTFGFLIIPPGETVKAG